MSAGVEVIYRYKAVDSMGRSRHGYIKAPSADEAFNILRQHSLYPYKITKAIWKLDNSIVQSIKEIPLKHIIIFCKQMHVIISSGIPLLQGLYGLYQDTYHRGLKKIIGDIYMDIQRGNSMSQSFKRYEDILPHMFCDMVHAGEVSGNLDQSFKYMAKYYEREYTLRKRLTNVLIYPIFVCILTIVLLQFLISYVTPYFIDIYTQSGEILPKSTKLLLNVHRLVGGMRFIFLIIVCVLGIVVVDRISDYKFHALILRLPIIGDYLTKVITTKICTVMSMVLKSGISMLDGLQMTQGTIKNKMVRAELQEIQDKINEEGDILKTFKSSIFFTPIFIQLLSVGVVSGNIGQAFDDVAKFYETEIEWETNRLLYIIEPVLILLVGLIVGFVSYALIIPIYSLIEVM